MLVCLILLDPCDNNVGRFLCSTVVTNIVAVVNFVSRFSSGVLQHFEIFSFLRAVTSSGLFMRFGYDIYDQEHSLCLVMTLSIVVWPLLTTLIP